MYRGINNQFKQDLLLFCISCCLSMVLSHDDRVRIVALRETGITIRQLAARFNVRPNTICDLVRKHQQTQSVDDRQRSGRPKKSTERQDRQLLRMSARSPRKSSRGLAHQWQQEAGVEVTARTVRSRLFKAGRFSYVAPKKPLLTARHRAARLQWAREHVRWTPAQWATVLFSDETPLHLVQTTQRRYFRSVRGRNRLQNIVQPRLQGGGGSVMVWGAFSQAGPLVLHRLEGTLTAQRYVEILNQHALPYFQDHPDQTFQQDNATSHKARLTMNWFQDNAIQVLQWPAVSPDLNPIENCWAYLKSEVDKIEVHGREQLFNEANRIFAEMPRDFIQNLIESMPQRCQQVIDRGGRHSDY